jgi:hypothetical protein
MNKLEKIILVTGIFLVSFAGATAGTIGTLYGNGEFIDLLVHGSSTFEQDVQFQETTQFIADVDFAEEGLVALKNRVILDGAEVYACGERAYTGVCPSSWNREYCEGLLIRCWMD